MNLGPGDRVVSIATIFGEIEEDAVDVLLDEDAVEDE
jgi:hypothetical protein